VVAGNNQTGRLKRVGPLQTCRFLLACLVALLVAFPFLEDVAKPLILIMPMTGVFVAAVLVADAGRRSVRQALIIATIQVGLTVVSLIDRESNPSYWIAVALALVATVALMLFSTYCLMGYVLRAQRITRDQLYAGICMYLMLGFAFGTLYYLLTILDPQSFAANVDLGSGQKLDLMYFSFVTLATLGYGDITPRTNLAHSLAIIEALAGMLFIAIFMARLVSLRSDELTKEPGE